MSTVMRCQASFFRGLHNSGLVGAAFRSSRLATARPSRPLLDPMSEACRSPKTSMPQLLSPWKMNKSQLVEELNRRGVPFHPSWLVPELRQMVVEIRQQEKPKVETSEALQGLSKCSLDELVKKATAQGITMPDKPTRGWLMRAIRDASNTPADTVVPFGKFKGWMYREIPAPYLEWAMAEVEGNPNSSMDLQRLASWAKSEKTKGKTVLSKTRSLATDPEALAKIPPPSVKDMFDGPSGSDASWSQVSTTRSKGTPVRRQMSEEEEINLLQSRLEMLQARQKKRESVMIVDGDETES